jgi:hypothetical protein
MGRLKLPRGERPVTASGAPPDGQSMGSNRSRGRNYSVYSVYVIELDAAACRDGTWKGCLYVGETGLRPEERLARHKAGGRTSAGVVRRYGIRLRPDLTRGIGPFPTRVEAQAAEARLAEELRLKGYAVFGGQGRTFALGRREQATSWDSAKAPASLPLRAGARGWRT